MTLGLGFTRSRQSATGGGSSSTGSSAGGSPGSGASRAASSDFLAGLDFSWELDVWGRIRRTVESNRASAQASAGDPEAARLSFQAQLAQDYFQLRTLDAQKQLLDETVAAFERFLRLTQDRFAAGVASQADVVQAETQLKTTQAQAIDVGVQRAQLEHAIAILRLAAFRAVEDNLAALRILETEHAMQDEAVMAARKSVDLTTNQYEAGTVSCLNVITAQTIALTDEVNAILIAGPANGGRRPAGPGPGRGLDGGRPSIVERRHGARRLRAEAAVNGHRSRRRRSLNAP